MSFLCGLAIATCGFMTSIPETWKPWLLFPETLEFRHGFVALIYGNSQYMEIPFYIWISAFPTSSVGMMKFPIWWESHSKFHGCSHHQPDFSNPTETSSFRGLLCKTPFNRPSLQPAQPLGRRDGRFTAVFWIGWQPWQPWQPWIISSQFLWYIMIMMIVALFELLRLSDYHHSHPHCHWPIPQ